VKQFSTLTWVLALAVAFLAGIAFINAISNTQNSPYALRSDVDEDFRELRNTRSADWAREAAFDQNTTTQFKDIYETLDDMGQDLNRAMTAQGLKPRHHKPRKKPGQ